VDIGCDVAVVGAGPAGASTASWLATAGLHVVMIERSIFDRPRPGESLAPRVGPLLADLGLTAEFHALAPLPSYGTESVWGEPTRASHTFLFTPFNHGYHVERARFDAMLATAAEARGVELRLGVSCTRVTLDERGGVRLTVACATGKAPSAQIRARFVVDATGRAASVSHQMGARRALFDRLVGVGVRAKSRSIEPRCCTSVEATPDGWWYAAPFSRDDRVYMFMTDGDLASAYGLTEAARFEAVLRTSCIGARAEPRAMTTRPRVYSAISQRSLVPPEAREARRFLAVGDAALAVDPISGSGVVRALRTGKEAAAAISSALSGRNAALAEYEQARDRECTAYLAERSQYYALERRYPDRPFWQRRALL
jgi:flavin-dependent dehydrogenase